MYERHLKTKKHNDNKMITNDNKKTHFMCDCGKSYKFQSGLSRHTMVCKNPQNANKMLTNANKMLTYACACGKEYTHRSTLSRHQKTCSFQETALAIPDGGSADIQATLLNALKTDIQNTLKVEVQDALKEEFQNKLVNTLKELLPQIAPTNITHNTNNITNKNRISNNQINIFLHEKCADAMSIQQFAKQLTFTIEDVLMKKHDALVKVINQNLNPLAVTERPVHCTNVARRRWHVKDETEGWKKDDGGLLLRKVNDSLLRKSPAQYADAFPEFITQPKRQDEYVEIVRMTSTDLEPKAEARVLTSVGEANQLDMNH